MEVESELFCPLSKQIMLDPVSAPIAEFTAACSSGLLVLAETPEEPLGGVLEKER